MGKLLKNQRNPNDADYAPTSESNWTAGIYILHEKERKKILRRTCFSYDEQSFDKTGAVTESAMATWLFMYSTSNSSNSVFDARFTHAAEYITSLARGGDNAMGR